MSNPDEFTIANVIAYVNENKNKSSNSAVSFQQNSLLQDQDHIYSNIAVNFPPMMAKPSEFITTLDSSRDLSRANFVPFMKKRE